MYFGWTETSKDSYAYKLHHVPLIQHNSDIQIQAWLEPPNDLIHYGRSCVNYYTTWITGGDAYNFWQKIQEEKHLKLSEYLHQI